MIILFEEYHYRTEDLSKILDERYYISINAIHSKINFVGYYFNPKIDEGKGDVIIIFPKVFIDENQFAFNEYSPEQLLHADNQVLHNLKSSGKHKIIFEISTWFYKAIQQFNKRHFYNSISENQFINQVVTNLTQKSTTELDIILSLIQFHKENQKLFTLISRTAHSQKTKINWKKTIHKKQPIVQQNLPVYLDLHTTRKQNNDNEELLILFYSTLEYIKEKYSFEFQVPQNYILIRGHQFEIILRKGCRILKNIRYKYFSDKMINLYDLLYTFFERSENIQSHKQLEEILLIRNFNIVFEDMIDDLIGDNTLFPELKYHADGKQVDHIYRYKSLLSDDDIYFVGDSKYYQPQNKTGKYAQAKQFTYAKNIIQTNIRKLNEGRPDKAIRYREGATEGYNITPNFFISALVNKEFSFLKSDLESVGEPLKQVHFQNRLFDRDTLFVQSYNINFLFVLSSYLSRNSSLKSNFKKETRKTFRDKFISFFNKAYCFYKVTAADSLFLSKHFMLLHGKIYKPSQFENEFLLAFEKHSDYQAILDLIKADLSSIEIYNLH